VPLLYRADFVAIEFGLVADHLREQPPVSEKKIKSIMLESHSSASEV
jgi:uncharacterized protein YneF (UPF0154 family)